MRGALGALTTRGRSLLAAGFAAGMCALVLDERDLLRVAAFVVALPLLATLVAGRARLGLHVVRRPPQRAPAGSGCEVTLTVHGTGRLGTGLLLEDAVPAVLGDSPRFAVRRLPKGAAVELRYRLHPELRGVHPIGPLVARVTDPLGLAEYGLQVAGRDRLVVTPVVLPLRGTPTGGGLAAGRHGGGRRHAGQGEDDAVVRSYRQGDDLRKVHWRSTARRDELMVRVEEWPWGGGTTVLLDHRAGAHRGRGASGSLEYAVSLAASACLHLQRRGHRVSLVTVDGRVRSGPHRGDGAEAMLDALARIVPAHQRDPAAAGTDAGEDLVAVLGRVTPADVAVLLRGRPWAGRSHAVLLDVTAWSPAGEPADGAADPQQAARLLAAAGWSVVVAGPDQPPDSAWDRLTSAGRAGALR